MGWRRGAASACRWMQRPCKEVFGHICLTHCCTPAAPHSIMTGHWHGSTTSCHLTVEFYHQRRSLNLATKLHSGFKSLKHINVETPEKSICFGHNPSFSLLPRQSSPGCQRQPAAVLPNPDRREIITWKKVIM